MFPEPCPSPKIPKITQCFAKWICYLPQVKGQIRTCLLASNENIYSKWLDNPDIKISLRSEVVTVEVLKIQFLWFVMPCPLVNIRYILFSSCQLAFSEYPDWGVSVLFPQLYGKCQGIPRKDGARSAHFLISELCCSMYYLCVNVYGTTATGWQPNCS